MTSKEKTTSVPSVSEEKTDTSAKATKQTGTAAKSSAKPKAAEASVTKEEPEKTTTKTTTKKTAAKKTTKSTAAAKSVSVNVEYNSRQLTQEEMLNRVKEDLKEQGVKESTVKKLDLYVQPENGMIYYVVNAGTAKELRGGFSI